MTSLKLVQKIHLTGNVWAFRFEPSEPLIWTPGQYIRVELIHDNPDAEGAKRWFTVSSAPYEGIIQITTRLTGSTFKRALDALPLGGKVPVIEPPEGDFIWQDSPLPKILVAGGIGITPFHSMFKQRVHDKLPLEATLIYGNRDTNIPFKDELDKWVADDSRFTIRYVTGMPLTAESLEALEPNLNQSLVYVSGPEPMVDALGELLVKHGLPKEQLKLDGLANYTQANY